MINPDLEDVFGARAQHSDYAINDHIRYQNEGQTYTGTIVHTLAPSIELGQELPTRYLVERDDQGGFPDIVWLSEVIELVEDSSK